jgi:hypothetical protein
MGAKFLQKNGISTQNIQIGMENTNKNSETPIQYKKSAESKQYKLGFYWNYW